MRIFEVIPSNNYILYVFTEENEILKFDRSKYIDSDPELYELKYYPELFITARLVNEDRSIGWGDSTSVPGVLIKEYGQPVNMGYMEVRNISWLEEMEKHKEIPIVRKALESRYGSMMVFEDGDFAEFDAWLTGMFVANLDEHGEPTDLAYMYEWMSDEMVWPEENEKDWLEDFVEEGHEFF